MKTQLIHTFVQLNKKLGHYTTQILTLMCP